MSGFFCDHDGSTTYIILQFFKTYIFSVKNDNKPSKYNYYKDLSLYFKTILVYINFE